MKKSIHIENPVDQKDAAFEFIEAHGAPELTRSEKLKRAAVAAKHVNIIAVCGLFVIISLIILFAPHPKTSDIEKRKLNEFPKFSMSALASGEFTKGITAYLGDTVPFRERLIPVNTNLKSLFGFSLGEKKNKIVFIGVSKIDNPEQLTTTVTPAVTTTVTVITTLPTTQIPGTNQTSSAVTTTAVTTTTAVVTTTTFEPEPLDVNNGIVIIGGDTGIMLYGGSFANGQKYAGYVNSYKQDLGESVNIYSMVIPTPVAYYLPDEYSSYTASEKDNIDNIVQYLSGVSNVDVYTELFNHKNEHIYTRTDHHWSGLGAYYAARKFCATAGVPLPDIMNYDEHSVEGYVGTLYGYTNSADLLNNPENFIYYTPKNTDYVTTYYSQSFTNPQERPLFNETITSKSSLYLTYIRGDNNVVKIDTGVKNGRKLIIFKDSYGNAVPGFLTESFEEIIVCDMRYFELNSIDFIKEQGITDVLFASCAFSATGSNLKHIERMRTQ